MFLIAVRSGRASDRVDLIEVDAGEKAGNEPPIATVRPPAMRSTSSRREDTAGRARANHPARRVQRSYYHGAQSEGREADRCGGVASPLKAVALGPWSAGSPREARNQCVAIGEVRFGVRGRAQR